MSPSDTLEATQAKMREYIDNGVKLGWLINRRDRQVEVYRPNQPTKTIQTPPSLSGEAILPDFVLNLQWLWDS